jgi:hypothetical protein
MGIIKQNKAIISILASVEERLKLSISNEGQKP